MINWAGIVLGIECEKASLDAIKVLNTINMLIARYQVNQQCEHPTWSTKLFELLIQQ